MNAAQEAVSHKQLSVPNDLGQDASVEITAELKALLADVFTLYIKTKAFHWHMTGRHFRDYHLLLDEQAAQIFDMTDDIAERAANWEEQLCAPSTTSRSTSA
jgi:starvation-inducible DNA-binding protein